MSFRRAAGTVARRWLAGHGDAGAVARAGVGQGGGPTVGQIVHVARFWSFGGSKGGDDEDGGKGDTGDQDVDVSTSRVDGSGDSSVGKSESNTTPSTADHTTTPETKSPKWNVPDDGIYQGEGSGFGTVNTAIPNATDPPSTHPSKKKKPKMKLAKKPTTSTETLKGLVASSDAPKSKSQTSSSPKNLYVKNLPRDFNAKKLAHLFLPHGDVQQTKFVLDAGPVPTGLVRFATAEEAAAAMAALHGMRLSEADGAMSDGAVSDGSSDSDSDEGIVDTTPLPPLEISLAMTRAERDAARVQRAEERELRKKQRLERTERKKKLAESKGALKGTKDGFKPNDFVGVSVKIMHVPAGLDHRQLRSIFSSYGKLGRVKMMWPNGETPSALVTFADETSANEAAATLGGTTLPGCKGPMKFQAHHVSMKQSSGKGKKRDVEVKKAGDSSGSDSSSSDSESESESESSLTSSETDAPSFTLDAESVLITEEVSNKRIAAKQAAQRVWRDVQASRAVSSPEALAAAKALNEAATKKFGELQLAKRADDRLRRRREARGDDTSGDNATHSPTRSPSPRVRAYAERRKEQGGYGQTVVSNRRAVAGPGVDVGEAMSEGARAKLAAAAARKRERGRGVGFAGMADVRAYGGRDGRGGRGGRGSDPRTQRGSRRGRDGDIVDEKTRAALAARVAEARDASSSDVPWEWDPSTFEQGARKTFLENFNVGEYNSAPWVPGFGEASEKTKRSYDSESDFLDRHKSFVMAHGGIQSDAQYESVKRETLVAFSQYTELYEKQRTRKGESPVEGDFLAERDTLQNTVSSVSKDNPLFDFANRAVDALDGNAGWSYGRKMAALRFLANKAERYEGQDGEGGAEQEAKE